MPLSSSGGAGHGPSDAKVRPVQHVVEGQASGRVTKIRIGFGASPFADTSPGKKKNMSTSDRNTFNQHGEIQHVHLSKWNCSFEGLRNRLGRAQLQTQMWKVGPTYWSSKHASSLVGQVCQGPLATLQGCCLQTPFSRSEVIRQLAGAQRTPTIASLVVSLKCISRFIPNTLGGSFPIPPAR